MRIDFRVDGGLAAFPGLARTVRIDCDALPKAQAAHLRELVQRADFFGLPSRAPGPPRPDARAYTIEVDDGRQCKSVTVNEPIDDVPLRELVAELRTRARVLRSGG